MRCGCSIIPDDVLRRLAEDPTLSDETRRSLVDTASLDAQIRDLRAANTLVTRVAGMSLLGAVELALAPNVWVYDCRNSTSLPGHFVQNPGGSADATAKRTFDETTAVVEFFRSLFGRNSVDDAGMNLVSSIHYGNGYKNAQWNGAQMIYGDGDGRIFLDFTRSPDVIGHEITHGVTQHTASFNYADEPGGLNESMSDVFGSMFRQWRLGQDVTSADWLIGAGIMGPAATERGFTCLRDMADPGAAHCLSRQPSHYSDYQPGMDPHYSSGIGNFAFYTAAMAMGGKSWERAGRTWYRALAAYGVSPNLQMREFADRTRESAAALFPGDQQAIDAVDGGWTAVGL